MTLLALFDIGFGEMVLVGFVALLLFGGRLPEVMRTMGLAYRKFRTGMDDLTRQTSRVLDVRTPNPPYKPTPPNPPTTPPVAVPYVPEGPSTAAPASDEGPVARSMPGVTVAPAPSVREDAFDDPPPV